MHLEIESTLHVHAGMWRGMYICSFSQAFLNTCQLVELVWLVRCRLQASLVLPMAAGAICRIVV